MYEKSKDLSIGEAIKREKQGLELCSDGNWLGTDKEWKENPYYIHWEDDVVEVEGQLISLELVKSIHDDVVAQEV